MSLYPLSSFNLNDSLIGIADPGKFVDPLRIESKDYSNKRIHELSHGETIKYTIVITCISAIIFVTIVAIYDTLHNVINAYYSENYLDYADNNISQETIERTRIANKNAIMASSIFALICIIAAIILIPLLLLIITK